MGSVLILASSCHPSGHTGSPSSSPDTIHRATNAHLSVVITPVQLGEGGWGYKVNVNGKPYIFQRQIPCIEGVRPFPTKESALAVAAMVKSKILNGQVPSVTKEDLEKVLPADILEDPQGSR